MPVKALPPQGSASANFATWAMSDGLYTNRGQMSSPRVGFRFGPGGPGRRAEACKTHKPGFRRGRD